MISEKNKKKLEAKTSRISNGMNNTTRSQLKKIKKADTTRKLEQVPMGELYVRLRGVWIHKGKYCYICNDLLGFDKEVILKHRYICVAINKFIGEDDADT